MYSSTLEPGDYPTVFGCHQEAPGGVASFKVYLDPNLATYIMKLSLSPLVYGATM